MAETTNKEFRPSQETVQKYLDGQAKVTCTAFRADAVKFGVLIASIATVATAWICTRHRKKTDKLNFSTPKHEYKLLGHEVSTSSEEIYKIETNNIY